MQSSLINSRRLQDSSNSHSSEPDIYEFLGFIAWYMFLVVCCVVPTVCAYRRRRMQHDISRRRDDQHAQIYFTNFRFDLRPPMEERDPAIQVERIQEALLKTTMVVESKDLLKRNEEGDQDIPPLTESKVKDQDDASPPPPESAPNDGDVDIVVDEEMGGVAALDEIYLDESDREIYVDQNDALQLPADSANGGRLVPAACAICLCAYEVGDEITWSPESSCQHAFHKDCIVAWLAKKSSHLCPCCRQEFCQLEAEDSGDQQDGERDISHEELRFGAMYPPAVGTYTGSFQSHPLAHPITF